MMPRCPWRIPIARNRANQARRTGRQSSSWPMSMSPEFRKRRLSSTRRPRQRRSKNASAGRRKNASRGLRQRRGSLAARMADCSVAPSGQAPRLRRAATRLWGLTASARTERSLLRRDARVAAVVSFQVAVVWISGVSGCARDACSVRAGSSRRSFRECGRGGSGDPARRR